MQLVNNDFKEKEKKSMKVIMRAKAVKMVTVVMLVLSMVLSSSLYVKNEAKAAELPSNLAISFGEKYNGTVNAVYNSEANAYAIEYFDVNNAFSTGDTFYISFGISGAKNFKQIAVQGSHNDYDWNAAPKSWVDNGIDNGTNISGILKATKNGANLSFKLQLDNQVTASSVATVPITLSNLYIVKIASGSQSAALLPADKQLDFGTMYTGTVKAVNDGSGVYEAQYFNLNNSAYSEGDTFVISGKVSGVSNLKQIAVQDSVNGFDWGAAPKGWHNSGITDGQVFGGGVTATGSGSNQSFKIRFDSFVTAPESLPAEIDVTLTDLVVVKVGNSYELPTSLQIDLNNVYSGDVTAVPDGSDSYAVQYFNVNNTAYQKDDLYRITFDVSGAQDFKQLLVQTSIDGWTFDSSREIWKSGGINDGTKYTVYIKAKNNTVNNENVAFKLWFGSADAGFNAASVPMTLNNLKVTKVNMSDMGSLKDAYQSKFKVGAAITTAMLEDADLAELIKYQYNTITAENEMKPDALLQQDQQIPGVSDENVVINTYSMDKILKFAQDNGLKVRFHALVYGAQTPKWFFKKGYSDDEGAANVSATVLENRMKNYITEVINYVEGKYEGVVTEWDVVNEAIENDGGYTVNNWLRIMGEEYVAKAFKYASDAIDSGSLFYNDYNLEEADKQDTVLALKDEIEEMEAHLDGIGMQEHITTEYPNIVDIESTIKKFARQGLNVQITELDVSISEGETEAEQAARYEELFTMFARNNLSNVTFWGVTDDLSWKADKSPLLFKGTGENIVPKEAFSKVLDVIK